MVGTISPSSLPGLDPAIHLLCKNALAKRMDPRVKPAGDAGEWVSAVTRGEQLGRRATPIAPSAVLGCRRITHGFFDCDQATLAI
jgi:hypothetical protein